MEYQQVIVPDILPKDFKNLIISGKDDLPTVQIRSNVANSEQIKLWMTAFEKNTCTKWIVQKTNPNGVRMVCNRSYSCHHSTINKTVNVAENKNKRGVSKNTNCSAKIFFRVKLSNRFTMRNDVHVKNGLPCMIKIRCNHNHSLTSKDALRYIPCNELKEKFVNYFNAGMCAMGAIKHHNDLLELDECTDDDYANPRINPPYRTVSYWFENWRRRKYDDNLFEVVEKKLSSYKANGVIISYSESPFFVFIVTPLMQRAHELPMAKEIVFVDTTSCENAGSHFITLLLTATGAGAVPIGVLITADRTTKSLIAGFRAIKSSIPDSFGGQTYPNVIMTDNVTSEIEAVEAVWPQAHRFLCIFHVLRHIWNWLRDSKNGIPENVQHYFFISFQEILYSTDTMHAEDAYENALAMASNFPLWLDYITQQWNIKQKWCLAYRARLVEQHVANIAEITMRMFKDNVMARVKAYNVVALIDFVCSTMEKFYARKLREYAVCKSERPKLMLEPTVRCYLKQENVVRINEFEYEVPSESDTNVKFSVNLKEGFCNCEIGKTGKFCKHLAAVYKFSDVLYEKLPSTYTQDREQIALVALGAKAPDSGLSLTLYVDQSDQIEFDEVTDYFEEEECLHDTNSYDIKTVFLDDDDISLIEVSESEADLTDSQTVSELPNLKTDISDLASEFVEILNQLCQHHRRFSSSTSGVNKLSARVKTIKTKEQWENFLHGMSDIVLSD